MKGMEREDGGRVVGRHGWGLGAQADTPKAQHLAAPHDTAQLHAVMDLMRLFCDVNSVSHTESAYGVPTATTSTQRAAVQL